jgi:hypothetical protein
LFLFYQKEYMGKKHLGLTGPIKMAGRAKTKNNALFNNKMCNLEFGGEVVPGEGLEPTSSYERRILSPLRLPIPPSRHVAYFTAFAACISTVCKKQLEATSGFGPLNGSFADSCLTTWLRRLVSLL